MRAFDCAVIGKGLIGCAAAKYLASTGRRVVVVGPDEPKNPLTHRGVFASHYDQGRITRLIGRDPVYSRLAARAVAEYPTIEAQSNVPFHFPVGMLIVDAPHIPDGHMRESLMTAREMGRAFDLYDVSDRSWKTRFPYYHFPATHRVIHEPAPAGYVNPRDLIRAQLTIAEAAGAQVVRETATSVRSTGSAISVETTGERFTAKSVVVCAGAFTNCHELVPRKLAFQTETETILLAGVAEEDAARLASAPTVIYLIEDPEIRDIYMTPPIRYPDGRFYVKLGANTVHDDRPESLDELGRWFRNGDSDRSKDALTRALRSLWPGLDFMTVETRRCILCKTPNGYPVIDEVETGVFVAAGGNGGSAKSSDALGALVAGLVSDEPWPDEIPRALFRAQYDRP